jgi:hypothetical protein
MIVVARKLVKNISPMEVGFFLQKIIVLHASQTTNNFSWISRIFWG